MPTYNAKCEKCDKVFEYTASITHEESPPCIECEAETKRTIIRNETGFVLKGDGFYKSGGFK